MKKFFDLGKKLLLEYQIDRSPRTKLKRGKRLEEDKFLIPNMVFIKRTDKQKRVKIDNIWYNQEAGANYYRDSIPLDMLYTTYIIKCWIPQSVIINEEVQGNDYDIPHNIVVNNWAYETCYLKKIRECVVHFGENIYNLLHYYREESPGYKYSKYRPLLDEMKKLLEK